MVKEPPAVPAFDFLPKWAWKEKKGPSLPNIHIHLLDNFAIGSSTSTQARATPKAISDVEQAMTEPSPSAFQMKFETSHWEF